MIYLQLILFTFHMLEGISFGELFEYDEETEDAELETLFLNPSSLFPSFSAPSFPDFSRFFSQPNTNSASSSPSNLFQSILGSPQFPMMDFSKQFPSFSNSNPPTTSTSRPSIKSPQVETNSPVHRPTVTQKDKISEQQNKRLTSPPEQQLYDYSPPV